MHYMTSDLGIATGTVSSSGSPWAEPQTDCGMVGVSKSRQAARIMMGHLELAQDSQYDWNSKGTALQANRMMLNRKPMVACF